MLNQMIVEISRYLAAPMRDSYSDEEQDERIFLCDLLADLKLSAGHPWGTAPGPVAA